MTQETLFNEALAKPPAERAAFLEQACAGQPELRAAVDALLAAHERSGHVLDKAALATPEGTDDYIPAPGDEVPPPIPQPRTGPYNPYLSAR